MLDPSQLTNTFWRWWSSDAPRRARLRSALEPVRSASSSDGSIEDTCGIGCMQLLFLEEENRRRNLLYTNTTGGVSRRAWDYDPSVSARRSPRCASARGREGSLLLARVQGTALCAPNVA